MAIAPVLVAQAAHAIQECDGLRLTDAAAAMVVFGDPDYGFHHIWKAAATAAALLKEVIDLGRNDELPRITVEKLADRALDFLLGDQVAVTDKHQKPWRPRPADDAGPKPRAQG